MTSPPKQFIVDEASGQEITTVEYRYWMKALAAAVEWLNGPCDHKLLGLIRTGGMIPESGYPTRRVCDRCWEEFRQGVKK